MSPENKPKTLSLNKNKTRKNTTQGRSRTGARARVIAQKNFNPVKDTETTKTVEPIKKSKFDSHESKRPQDKKAQSKFKTNRSDQQLKPGQVRHNIIFPSQTETFNVFAPCPHGLEHCLADELIELGYSNVNTARAGCQFTTNWPGILKANLYSRIATRILVQVAQAQIQNENDLLYLAYKTPWEYWFGPKQKLRVDISAIRSPMKSLQYCNLRVKDGICDRLREREGARPDIDTVRPDAKVHTFLNENSATLYLDVSGESLFKRGWRLDKGLAPIRENLAAGLLSLSGWDRKTALMDPFCGSGTILIEAAWLALGVPAGIWRPFGFERLRNHNARLWHDLKEQARANIQTHLELPITGGDTSEQAIAAARANLQRANLSPDTIDFVVADARKLKPNAETGHIITNPPYGERMNDVVLWPEWASWLKEKYHNWQINIISSDLNLPAQLRLKPKRRHPVFNGALDCRLFQFELVDGKYI